MLESLFIDLNLKTIFELILKCFGPSSETKILASLEQDEL